MKIKKVISLIVSALIIFALASCTVTDTTTKSNSEQSKETEKTNQSEAQTQESENEPTEETIEGVGTLGKYGLEILNYEIGTDYQNQDSIIITYNFTNNSDENAIFTVAISAKAFQDGVELSPTVISGEGEDELKEIKSGATIEVRKAYVLSNLESPVEVEAKELISLDKSKVTKTFEIAN